MSGESGSVCPICGTWTPLGYIHTCLGTTTKPMQVNVTTERPRRRHVTGRITPVDRMGKQYDVDLWVEDVP